jgi:site-specific DNA recombinase
VKIDAIYARVSSEEQKRKETIKSQVAEVEKYCAGRGVTVGKVYADEGVFGSRPLARRAAGAELLRDAEAGLLRTIFTWKFDRISRSLRDFLNLYDALERHGVQIVSVTQPIPPGPAGRTLMQMVVGFAELDRANIIENTFRGHSAKAAVGGYRGGWVSFGYAVDGVKRTATLVPHPQYAAVVKWMFEQYDAGKTCPNICEELNRRGVPTPRGAIVWRPNSVLAILRNPIYTGTGQWARRRWERRYDEQGVPINKLRPTPERTVATRVPALVSQELFDRVQVKLTENQLTAMAHPKNDYLLHRLITCGICGLKFTGRGTHYSCIGRHCGRRLYGNTRPPCAAPAIKRVDIEAAVWAKIENFLRKPGDTLRELEKQIRIESSPLRISEKIREAEKERAQQEKKLERIQLLYVEGDITADRRREMRDRVITAITAIEEKIATLRQAEAEQHTAERGVTDAQTVLESLRDAADGMATYVQKRKAVMTLVDSITVERDGRTRIAFVFQPDATRFFSAYGNAPA